MLQSEVSNLVTGKSPKYLRNAATLLCAAMVLLGATLTLIEAQRQRNDRDFSSNASVHVIELSAPANGKVDDRLRFVDVARATRTLHKTAVGGGTISTRLEVGFGIPDSEGKDRFITGLDGDSSRLLGLKSMADDTVYSTSELPAELRLLVPVVKASEGGMTSTERAPRRLATRTASMSNTPMFVLGRLDPQTLFVSGRTFRSLMSVAFDRSWQDIESSYDANNPFSVSLIRNIYVYVDDLGDVKKTAQALEKDGFTTGYTFKAFANLAGSLDRAAILGIGAVALVVLVSILLSLVNLNSYLRLTSRDMGILRHIGYSRQQVHYLYRRRVARIVVGVAIAAAVISTVLSVIVLGVTSVNYLAINLAILLGVLSLIYLGVTTVMLPQFVSRDVLRLLKLDREFD